MTLYPIVVIEGPDCAGKTTLADMIMKIWGAEYVHLTYRFKDRMDQYHTAALEKVLKIAENKPVILDRWWASEIAYAAAFRGGTRWPLTPRMFDRVALMHSFTYIWCMPANRDAYLEHHIEKKEGRYAAKAWALRGRNGNEDSMAGVFDNFWKIYQWAGGSERPDFVLYDFMTDGQRLEEFVHEVLQDAFDRYYSNRFCWAYDSVDRRAAGNVNGAKFLLIGDKSNPKGRHKTWPFCENQYSSAFITKTLEMIGVHEKDLAWININGPDGEPQFTERELDQLFENKTQVALGRNAWLSAAIPSTKRVHHPAWYSRFKPAQMVIDLQEVLGPIIKEDYPHDYARDLYLA